MDVDTKEMAYILGLLWTDGWLSRKHKGKYYSLAIRILKSDLSEIKPVFIKTNVDFRKNWSFYEYKNPSNKPTWKTMEAAYLNNKNICDWFLSIDFDKKSFISLRKVLSKIPSNLLKYFWRGIVDGDGCFYIGKNRQAFSISSSFSQDWTEHEKLFKWLNLKYKINKVITTKNHKSSSIILQDIKSIILFGKWIYGDYESDKIGLIRKYNKFMHILNKWENPSKHSKYNRAYKGIFIKSPNGNILEIINIGSFSKENKISISGITSLLKGKSIQWMGWTLPNTEKQQIAFAKSHRKSKIYNLQQNGVNISINNLSSYCRDNKLSRSSMGLLLRHKILRYKDYSRLD